MFIKKWLSITYFDYISAQTQKKEHLFRGTKKGQSTWNGWRPCDRFTEEVRLIEVIYGLFWLIQWARGVSNTRTMQQW